MTLVLQVWPLPDKAVSAPLSHTAFPGLAPTEPTQGLFLVSNLLSTTQAMVMGIITCIPTTVHRNLSAHCCSQPYFSVFLLTTANPKSFAFAFILTRDTATISTAPATVGTGTDSSFPMEHCPPHTHQSSHLHDTWSSLTGIT